MVAEAVVDLFEIVDVEIEQREPVAGRRAGGNRAIELQGEALAVGEAGQRVVLGKKFRFLARGDEIGEVAPDRQHAGRGA